MSHELCVSLDVKEIKVGGIPIGETIWRQVKPIIQGYIFYTPNTYATRKIIQKVIELSYELCVSLDVKEIVVGGIPIGETIWRQVKPMIQDYIFYTPDTNATRKTIQKVRIVL